jgi:hypothetical protein
LSALFFFATLSFLSVYSTISHITKDAKNATRYPRADFITIFSNRRVVEKIESIRSEVETGIPLKRVKKTSINGNSATYHSILKSAYHLASRRPYVISPADRNPYHITPRSTAATPANRNFLGTSLFE